MFVLYWYKRAYRFCSHLTPPALPTRVLDKIAPAKQRTEQRVSQPVVDRRGTLADKVRRGVASREERRAFLALPPLPTPTKPVKYRDVRERLLARGRALKRENERGLKLHGRRR